MSSALFSEFDVSMNDAFFGHEFGDVLSGKEHHHSPFKFDDNNDYMWGAFTNSDHESDQDSMVSNHSCAPLGVAPFEPLKLGGLTLIPPFQPNSLVGGSNNNNNNTPPLESFVKKEPQSPRRAQQQRPLSNSRRASGDAHAKQQTPKAPKPKKTVAPKRRTGKRKRKIELTLVNKRQALLEAQGLASSASNSTDEEVEKKERNKASAAKYRQKQKDYVNGLEEEVLLLREEVAVRDARIAELESELKSSRLANNAMVSSPTPSENLASLMPQLPQTNQIIMSAFFMCLLVSGPLLANRMTPQATSTVVDGGAQANSDDSVYVRRGGGRVLLSLDDGSVHNCHCSSAAAIPSQPTTMPSTSTSTSQAAAVQQPVASDSSSSSSGFRVPATINITVTSPSY